MVGGDRQVQHCGGFENQLGTSSRHILVALLSSSRCIFHIAITLARIERKTSEYGVRSECRSEVATQATQIITPDVCTGSSLEVLGRFARYDADGSSDRVFAEYRSLGPTQELHTLDVVGLKIEGRAAPHENTVDVNADAAIEPDVRSVLALNTSNGKIR